MSESGMDISRREAMDSRLRPSGIPFPRMAGRNAILAARRLLSSSVGRCLAIAILWRILLAVAGVLIQYLLPACRCVKASAIAVAGWPSNPLSMAIEAASRGDAAYYTSIAAHGYSYSAQHYSTMGFYPLYPLAIKLVSLATGNVFIAALVVSTLCFLGAIALFARWLEDQGISRGAVRCTILLLCFPFSFFYGAMYAESLFLLLALATFMLAERRRWGAAALCVALLVLARPTGIIMLPVLFTLIVVRRSFSPAALLPFLAAALAQAAFMGYQYWRFGTALAYVRAKAVPGWGVTPSRVLDDLLLRGVPGRSTGLLALMLVIGLLFLAAVPLVYRRFGLPYAVFAALVVLGSMSAGLPGLHRYVIVSFPTFAAVTLALPKRTYFVVCVASAYCLLVFADLYVGGYGLA